jgi:RHS repeat-associated protein
MVVAVLAGGLFGNGQVLAASAVGNCYVAPVAKTLSSAEGVYRHDWMRGQNVFFAASAFYTETAPDACGGGAPFQNWTLKVVLPTCGTLPTRATGSSQITADGKPGTPLFSETFTIPDVCPTGSQFGVGQPLGTGPASLQLTGTGPQGVIANYSNFWLIDGRPNTACPTGRATGDAGCGEPAGDPVNTLTGAFMYADKDFEMPVRGGALEVWRSYDSQLSRAVAMGTGWTYAYSDSLVIQSGVKVTWRTSSGASIEYAFQSGTTWKAPFGHSSRLTQNANGTFTVKTEDLWSLDFTSSGVFTKATDRNGQATTISRDGSGRVDAVTRSGRSLTYGYNSGGDLTSVTATGSSSGDTAVTQYAYTSGQLSSVTKADGSQTLYGYDTSGRLNSIRNAATSTAQMQVAYGTDNRVTSQTDGNGKVTGWSWNATTKTSTMTDPRGGEWKDVYSNSWLIKQVDPTGIETLYDWNEDGTLFRVRAPGGQEAGFDYDSSGRLTARIDAFGRAERLTYTGAYFDPATSVDEAGRTTSLSYDSNRNVTVVTPPITTAKTTTTYTSSTFDVASFKDPTQQTTTFTTNSTTGDLTEATSPLGNKMTTTTDRFGWPASTTPAPGNVSGATGNWSTVYDRDALGRVTKVTDPRGVIATTTYDDFGRVATVKDARNHVTSLAYDNAGHVITITKPDESTEEFTYDDNGNVATATDGRGNVKTVAYDAANRPTSVTYEGRTWEYTYDSAGRRRTTEAPSGRTVTFDYDERSLPTRLDYSDSTPDVEIGYDLLGRKQTVEDGTGTWEYDYDALDRPTTVSHGSDEWEYTWDAAGRLASRKAPGQSVTSYTYDNDGRLAKVSRGGTDLATYAYDTADNKITRTQANGIVTVETFDRSGNLASSVEKTSGGTTTHSLTYTRDLQGNPIKVVDANDDSRVQEFDERDRLTAVCESTTTCDGATDYIRYGYDENSNLISETRSSGTIERTFDDHDQLTEETEGTTTRTFGYDDDGNRTSADGTTYTVNAAGQITSSTTGSTTTDFTYNAVGLVATKTSGGTTTKLDYDPILSQLVGQRDGSTVTHEFVYGRELVAMTAGSSTDYYTTDELGSVLATRNSSGGLETAYQYEPYGKSVSQTGSGTVSPLQFTSGLNLGNETYRFGLRQYGPATGTFTTPDPAETGETYCYASGNPVVYNDPLGLAPITPGSASNYDSLLDGGPSQAWGDLISSSVVRSAIGGSTYSGGSLRSRALKPEGQRVVSDCLGAAFGAALVISFNACRARGSDGSSAYTLTPGLGGGFEAGYGYSRSSVRGISRARDLRGWSGEVSGGGLVGGALSVATTPSGKRVYGKSVSGNRGLAGPRLGLSFQVKYSFIPW